MQHGDDEQCEDMEVRRRHFDALCEHVARLNGVASAVCAIRTNCEHGRHACAPFMVVGSGDERRVLARNSTGGKNPILEISVNNFAWWMTLDPVVLGVWDAYNREMELPEQSPWYLRSQKQSQPAAVEDEEK